MPHLVRRLVTRVRRRGAVEGFARPMNGFGPEGLRWWQFDVGKEDGGLDASGNRRVLDDTESSFGNGV